MKKRPELPQGFPDYKIMERPKYWRRLAASAIAGGLAVGATSVAYDRFHPDPFDHSSVAANPYTLQAVHGQPSSAEVTGTISLTAPTEDAAAIAAARGRFLTGAVVNYGNPTGFSIDIIECSSTDGHLFTDKITQATFDCTITYKKDK